MHLVAFVLDLVPAKDTQKFVLLKQLFNWFLTEIVGALALWILLEV